MYGYMNGMPSCCSWSYSRGTVQTKVLTYDETDADDLLTLFKLHSRVQDNTQDALIKQYLRAAVSAAENYTGRDFFHKTYKLLIGEPQAHPMDFRFNRGGMYAGLVVTDSASQVVTTLVTIEEFKGPKGFGFRILFDHGYSPYTLDFTNGYADLTAMPGDVTSFVLQVASALYEVREVINYTAMVQNADMLPVYLLDAWRIPGFA